jgi:5-oxoprolinase (ATP-hydrolysing) subunit A
MITRIDFNSDMGESFGLWQRGADEAMLGAVSSANVACGFHAGDPTVMWRTLEQAKQRGVAVGAHPGLPDLLGFGRRRIDVVPSDARDYVLYQLGALAGFCRATGLELHHVKFHGAFYMMALDDGRLARAVAEAVALFEDRLLIYTLAGSEMWNAATAKGLRPVPEFFLDRPLRRDGTVVMFNWWEHFEATPEVVAARAVSVATTGQVVSLEGEPVSVSAETLCVHSDTPGADQLGPAVRDALEAAGVTISAP